MQEVKVKIAEGGRIVIPAEYRQALGLQVGDEVLLRLEDQEVRLYTIREAIRRAQQVLRRYVPEGAALVESLLTDRRAEDGGE